MLDKSRYGRCVYHCPDERYDFQWTRGLSLHAGADLQIVKEFIEAIRERHMLILTQ